MSYNTKTDFFQFEKFYSRLKNHITHFQLRSLVVCSSHIADGIYYPSSYFHDDTLNMVVPDVSDLDTSDCHSFFKLLRLSFDEMSVSNTMKLDCLIDSRALRMNANSRMSSAACSRKLLATGTFEGGFILLDVADADHTKTVGEFQLTNSADGITNHICISDDDAQLVIASNDASLRIFDVEKTRKTLTTKLSYAINCLAQNPSNPNEYFAAADSRDYFVIDKRCLAQPVYNPSTVFSGHRDFGFSCDWSPSNEHLLVSGNQDGTVRLWDRRNPGRSVHCWNSALGSHSFDIDGGVLGGPVRNCKFGPSGKHVVWAESLDHVGVLQVEDLRADDLVHARVQSIDFIGKCIGLNVCLAGTGGDESLVIGVNDCPLGGILTYKLEAPDKPLDFEFGF